MIKQFGKRLNALEKQYSPQKRNLLLISKDESETLQETFDRSEKPGKVEDYKILRIIGVSVKG
jgi:hypothetical protein